MNVYVQVHATPHLRHQEAKVGQRRLQRLLHRLQLGARRLQSREGDEQPQDVVRTLRHRHDEGWLDGRKQAFKGPPLKRTSKMRKMRKSRSTRSYG